MKKAKFLLSMLAAGMLVFTACEKDEVDALNAEVEALEAEVNGNTASLSALQSEFNTAVAQAEAFAQQAQTGIAQLSQGVAILAQALEESITVLNAAIIAGDANNAQIAAAALAQAQAALQAEINALSATAFAYDSATGILNITLANGETYATGDLRGANGRAGAQGAQGPVGAAGADGAQGAAGADGADGSAGASAYDLWAASAIASDLDSDGSVDMDDFIMYLNGEAITITSFVAGNSATIVTFSDGTSISIPHGQDGADGTGGAGTPGPAGPAGADGTDGTNGADGADGADGRGIATIALGDVKSNGCRNLTITYTSGNPSIFEDAVCNGADGADAGADPADTIEFGAWATTSDSTEATPANTDWSPTTAPSTQATISQTRTVYSGTGTRTHVESRIASLTVNGNADSPAPTVTGLDGVEYAHGESESRTTVTPSSIVATVETRDIANPAYQAAVPDPADEITSSATTQQSGGISVTSHSAWSAWTPATAPSTQATISQTRSRVQTVNVSALIETVTTTYSVQVNGVEDTPALVAPATTVSVTTITPSSSTSSTQTETREIANPAYSASVPSTGSATINFSAAGAFASLYSATVSVNSGAAQAIGSSLTINVSEDDVLSFVITGPGGAGSAQNFTVSAADLSDGSVTFTIQGNAGTVTKS